MRKYQHFSVRDFVADEYFQLWIQHPTAENDLFWNNWMEQHPEKIVVLTEARDILHTLQFSNYALSNDDVSKLWSRIKAENDHALSGPVKQSSKKYIAYWASTAAVLVIGFTVAFFHRADQSKEYHTTFGETKTIILPDSSTVILNANSRITLADSWSEKPVREILLEGEAYFSVVHKRNHQPFKVNTPNGVAVEVLGTTFNVYQRKIDTKVVLNSGKIRLSIPDQNNHRLVMKPGEMVELVRNSYIKRPVNAKQYVSWTEHKIVLDHTTLGEMIRMAKDNYGIQVDVMPEAVLQQTVSGSMPVSREPKDFVKHVGKIFQLKVEISNDQYLIRE